MRQHLLCLTLLAAICCPLPAVAQDDELTHGLLAELHSGVTAQTVTRVDDVISEKWDGAPGDSLLPLGPFSARWSGQLLVRDDAAYAFHLYVQGRAEVLVDGQRVLMADAAEPRWVSGSPADLEFGFHKLQVTYARTTAGGEVHLYWSSPRFPLEPVPAHLLFRDEDDTNAERDARIAAEGQGRQLFDGHRCNRCHRRAGEPLSPPGPDLTYIAAGTDAGWLIRKLRSRHATSAGDRMPVFGFSEDEARALTAYLQHSSQPLDLPTVPAIKMDPKTRPPDGDQLLTSLGCLACHRLGDVGNNGPFGSGDLTGVGAKRSREWLFAQLTNPTSINAHARMPVFELSEIERVQLVDALSKLDEGDSVEAGPEGPFDDVLIEEGRQLYVAARCAACHPRDSENLPEAVPLENHGDWSETCLAEAPDRSQSRPAYPQADRDALKVYVSTRIRLAGPRTTSDPYSVGQLLLERNNCLGCHERGLDTGIVPTAGHVATTDGRLAGQSQALIPPSLTAVGDKLVDKALALAVSGEQPRRMPWLHVRMPRFRHTEAEKQALAAYFIARDRIPDGAPETLHVPELETVDEQTLLTGRALVGATGFSCIACHECGPYVPPNVAIATHGSDLLKLSERMRPEYFLRWTRSPLRIVPGMEMPSYERPVPGVLDGRADTQIAALWHALNDPRFTVPTNPTAVEQLLTVQPGDAPRIVRDVFTVPPENGGGYAARALAMGFGNGHSILFDVDRACVRGWTIGEFAQQRTQGKSWFWDLAGTPLATGFGTEPEFVLEVDGKAVSPSDSSDAGGAVRLRRYAVQGSSVVMEYDVTFVVGQHTVTTRVKEEWSAQEQADGSGVTRRIEAVNTGAGELKFRLSAPDADHSRRITMSNSSSSPRVWTVSYSTPLQRVQGPPLEPSRLEFNTAPVTTAPGFDGVRLPLPPDIMPTGLAWRPDGSLAFTSLKGHVLTVRDTDGDGVEDAATLFEEGLAAPFGVLPDGDDLLVAHKPELLRLRDTDGDSHTDERIVLADGWGYTHDYHDWTAGPVRDADGNLFLAISSDYSNSGRDPGALNWRGKVLRLATTGELEPFAHELRFPMGIAFDSAGRLFVSDQQGVQNTFNEIDHIVPGGRYGVPAQADPKSEEDKLSATVQIPHPWTRSVNGIFFLPARSPDKPIDDHNPVEVFAGHGVGCEYNGRFLIRLTTQEVDGQLQGAVYEFTAPAWDDEANTFLGPICGGVSPDGSIYIGSIFDSGWLGGRNTGEIVRLTPNGNLPNGLLRVEAVPGGFGIDFIRPVDREQAADAARYSISGYTRIWQGAYATPDSERYSPEIRSVTVSDDGLHARLHVDDLRAGFVYELSCDLKQENGQPLQPRNAHYTMNRVPE